MRVSKLLRAFRRPDKVLQRIRDYWEYRNLPRLQERARSYLQEQGVLDTLVQGDSTEIPPARYDLYYLHSQIVARRPKVVLEFGVGFSTITMAHALRLNHQQTGEAGTLWTVDTSDKWLANTEEKLGELAQYVKLVHANAQVMEHRGELCHVFESLPDIVPQMVLVDGPYGPDVRGAVRGLSFQPDHEPRRYEVSADMLLLESSLIQKLGFLLVVDGRANNVQFLRRHLRREYRVRQHAALKFTTFELLE